MKKKIIKNITMFILYFVYPLIMTIFIKLLKINSENFNALFKNIFLILTDLPFFLFAICMYKSELKADINDFKKNGLTYLFNYIPVYAFGVIMMGISNTMLFKLTNTEMSTNEQLVRNYIKLLPIYMAFSTSLYAPIIEEITFRKTFKNIFENKYIFILVSGIMFGLVHVAGDNPGINDYLLSIPYMIMGVDFAYIYAKTNNIFTTISIHALHNTILLIIQLIGG